MNDLIYPLAKGSSGDDWASRGHRQTLVLMGFTVLGGYLCYRLAMPFLPALAWALALAVLFTPWQERLESKLRRPSVAALISTLLIGVIVVVPVTFVGQQLVVQAAKGAEVVEARAESGEWRRALEAQPRLAQFVEQLDQRVDLSGTVKTFTTWLSTLAGSVVRGSVSQAIDFLVTFYLLFFFLRDRHAALRSLRAVSPLPEMEMSLLLGRVSDTIHATIYGTLVVAGVQGMLGGLMFWWLGLPAPLLWGVVMGLLAVVPVLGAFVVWIPAALFLVLEGSWGKALLLTFWGSIVVGTVDNLLYPILLGNRLKLHTVLAFISVVGGLMLFGQVGLVLGPVILTATLVLLEIWARRNRAEAAEVPRGTGVGDPQVPAHDGFNTGNRSDESTR